MTTKSILSWGTAITAIMLALVAAAAAVLHYRTFQSMQHWSYNDILQARDDWTWTWYRPVAIIVWGTAGVIAILNTVVAVNGRASKWWLPPAVSIGSVLACGVLILASCFR